MIIGISGKIGSGKDTIRKIIQFHFLDDTIKKKYGLSDDIGSLERFINDRELEHVCTMEPVYCPFQKRKFADNIRQMIRPILSPPDPMTEMFKEWRYERWECTGRDILIAFGDCARREIHEDFWVDLLFDEYNHQIEYGKYTPSWIISDVRYLNEVQAIKERDGIIIRVESNSRNNHKYKSESGETELDDYADFDYTLRNDSDIAALSNKIKIVIEDHPKLRAMYFKN